MEMKFFLQKCKILVYFISIRLIVIILYIIYYILKYYFIKLIFNLIFGNKDESKYSACGRLTP
jgi:hypothetical protein